MGKASALWIGAALAAVAIPASGVAQDVVVPCRLCTADGTPKEDKPVAPVRIQVEASLDFDRLVVSSFGSGSAKIGPDGSNFVSGSVDSLGARAMVGKVVILGDAGKYVRVELPRGIILHGSAGGVIQLDAIRTDLPPLARLDSSGRLEFRFGGELKIDGNLDGDFRGDIPIDVDYF